MTITFLGTRANIPIRSRRHRRHSAMVVSGRHGRLLIDCGEDWRRRAGGLRPTAILVTHAHPDHAGGLRRGAECPVYATEETWRVIGRWPLKICGTLPLCAPVAVAGFVVECWPVEHSLNAPAAGFKISTSECCLFYVPDVAALIDLRRTLRGVDLYIGDGATLTRSLVRERGRDRIGHTSVARQLGWCRRAGVTHALFTHCGSDIVRMPSTRADALVRSLGRACGVDANLAFDGLTTRLPGARLLCGSS